MTRPLEEALFQHFIHQKLEIAYAINKPFPFFEGLRDNNFITDTLYRVSHIDGFAVAAPAHQECLTIKTMPQAF